MQKLSHIVAAAAVLVCMPAGVSMAQNTPNTGPATSTTPVLIPAAHGTGIRSAGTRRHSSTIPRTTIRSHGTGTRHHHRSTTTWGHCFAIHRTAIRSTGSGTRRHGTATCRYGTANAATAPASAAAPPAPAATTPDATVTKKKEDSEDDTAAGDRKIYRQPYSTSPLSQISAERISAIYSVREIVTIARSWHRSASLNQTPRRPSRARQLLCDYGRFPATGRTFAKSCPASICCP